MEKENEKDVPLYSETAYDDAFRTMEGRCDDLLIHFVSHMFGEKYDKSAVVKRLRNEQYVEHEDGASEKRVTDSHFEIRWHNITKRYHLECESQGYNDEILVRIFEYGSQIAKDTKEVIKYKARFSFPNSGLLLLKSSKAVPDAASIEIAMPNGQELSFDVPIIKMADYTVDDIFREELYMLIPFYIFNYGDKLKEINVSEEKTELLLNEYRMVFEMLEEKMNEGLLSAVSYDAIIRLTHSVAYKYTMNTKNIQKKVGDVMGGKVLDLPSFRIYDQGKAEGKAEGEQERKELKNEVDRLRKELEELKARQ